MENILLEKAQEAYKITLEQGEDKIITYAYEHFIDEELQEYAESSIDILKQGWVSLVWFKGVLKGILPDTLAYTEEELSSLFDIKKIENTRIGTNYSYIRPKRESGEILGSFGEPEQTEEAFTLNEDQKKNDEKCSSINPSIIQSVKDVINNLYSYDPRLGEGWVDCVKLTPALKSRGIDYKELGYEKLRAFLESMSKDIEFNQVSKTELHIRLVQEREVGESLDSFTKGPTSAEPKKRELSSFERLMSFAFFPPKADKNGYTIALSQLEEIAKEETWKRGTHYFLQNYFQYTYDRILFEDSCETNGLKKKLREGNKYATFNTGLVNSFYSPIYALFERNRNRGKQPWVFGGFHVESEQCMSVAKKEEGWADLPKAARFYNDPDDLVFDVDSQIDAVNWEHIVIDNISRIPFKYIKRYSPQGFELEDNPCNAKSYFEKLQAAVRNDEYAYRKLIELFRNSMNRAVCHATWNFRYPIPMYYPTKRKISMLLPLALEDARDNNHVDIVMALERDKEHRSYTATTIMTLEQVYCNVRLLTNPDEDCNWFSRQMSVNQR